MSIHAISGIVPEWYAPAQDDADDKTEFQLKPLNGLEHAEVYSTCRIESGMVVLTEKSISLCIRYGLIGWRNFTDSDCNKIEFSRDAVWKVPGGVLFMIASKIFNISALSEAGKKK